MGEPRWEPRWDFYETEEDGARMVVTLDLAAARHAPVVTHPVQLQVQVLMRSPRPDGLRSREEAPALFALEDALVKHLSAAQDAIYLGRFVTRGTTVFVFHLPEAARGGSPLLGFEGDSAYPVRWLVEEDPAWRYRLEVLEPDPYQRQQMSNRRLLQVLEEHQDRSEVPRVVEHWASFEAREPLERAAAALAGLGFGCDAPAPPEGERTTWGLRFRRQDALDGDRADRMVGAILDVVLPLGGDYDGWETPVVKSSAQA